MKSEYLKVMRQLRKHHALFAQFWGIGDLIEIDHPRMPTAGIAFDKAGKGIQFLINPTYWATLTDHDKAFVISHECLHVYFDHGHRMLELDRKMANLAQDIVINHYLVDVFGFKREELTHGEAYCWRDTMFPGRDDIEEDRCFEYYYQKLKEQGGTPQDGTGQPGEGEPQQGQGGGKNQTVDVHDFLDGTDEEMLEAIQKAVDDLMDRITPEEVEDFEEIIEQGNQDESSELQKQQAQNAGTMSGGMKKRIRLGRIVKKRTWENVVADILGRFTGMEKDVDLELWTRPNRRLGSLSGNLMLPASVTESIRVKDRIDVFAFQDTSGSCVNYAKRFFKAIATIPDDRFRIRIFCFDTQTYETSLASGELFGFGGTRFQPIEDCIQSIMNKEGVKYPQSVFILTDGYGDIVHPQHPDRWNWFLTKEDYTDSYIPSKSHKFNLEDYE